METKRRRSIRLRAYDYTRAGAYFITIVSFQRQCLFGKIIDAEMVLSTGGSIAVDEWRATAWIRPDVDLDAFVIMPNHVHGIVIIADMGDRGARPCAPTEHGFGDIGRYSLGSLVRSYKAAVTRRIRVLDEMPERRVWQRNYYERVIRNERELHAIRRYIEDNPLKWAFDEENPDA